MFHTSVKAEEIKDGIYLNTYVTGTLSNALKKCFEGSCTNEDAQNNGVYIDASSGNDSGEYSKLIKCTMKSGCISKKPTENTYYLEYSSKNDNNKYTKLIKCYGEDSINDNGGSGDGANINKINNRDDDGEIKCSVVDINISNSKIEHYISDFNGEYDSLISCKNDGCLLENKDIVGYFFNSDKNDGKIIVCENEDCNILEEYELENNCSNSGMLIYKNKKYYICLSNTVEIELSNKNKGNYLVKASDDNIFTEEENHYAIVALDAYAVFLDKSYKRRFIYVDRSNEGKYKIIESSNNCPKKEGSSVDYENILELSECENGICKENK